MGNSNFGGGSVLAGVSAGLEGATDSVSLTVKDCMFKLQGKVAADLDVGAFVGGSVSVNPCKILKALDSGLVSDAHVIVAFGKKAAKAVAAEANKVGHAVEHVASQAVHAVEHAFAKKGRGHYCTFNGDCASNRCKWFKCQ